MTCEDELAELRSQIAALVEKWRDEAARAVPLATNAATESIRQAALRCAAELESLLSEPKPSEGTFADRYAQVRSETKNPVGRPIFVDATSSGRVSNGDVETVRENARLREALADCLRHLDFEAGDDDQYATGARNKARAALSEPKETQAEAALRRSYTDDEALIVDLLAENTRLREALEAVVDFLDHGYVSPGVSLRTDITNQARTALERREQR
jgi:hypothetical protein